MKESFAIAKEADTMSSPTKSSDKTIHRIQNEPERQLGSLRGVIDTIRRDGCTPSVDSIATELSSMPTVQRASVLLALQRTHGNQYVQRVVAGIQAKLKVGQPGDIYEQEADRVADAVMRMPEPVVQRSAEKEVGKEILLTKEVSGQSPEVTTDLEARIQAPRGGGQPLPESARAFFDARFGHDFSKVQVHTDSQAVSAARELNAQAFTKDQDIFFDAGRYQPNTTEGLRLLAHELTHSLQQRPRQSSTTRGMVQPKSALVGSPDAVKRVRQTAEVPSEATTEPMSESSVSEARFTPGVGPEVAPEIQPAAETPPKATTETVPASAPEAVTGEKPVVSAYEGEKKQKAETLAGEGKGVGGRAEMPESAPTETKKVPISAEDPGRILEQLKNTPPISAFAAYDKAQETSAVALEKQRQQVEQSLPEFPSPTGLPPQKPKSKERGKIAPAREKARQNLRVRNLVKKGKSLRLK